MITVSVIIPSYKPNGYLKDCIESFVQQTLDTTFFEVLIVLNGDKEPFFSDISDLIQDYHNIKLIYTPLKGVSNARNIGIESSIGDYICFIDDDDIVSPSYLERLLEQASADTISISNVRSFKDSIAECGNDFFICKHLEHKERYIDQPFFKCRSFFAFPVAKMIHRSIISEHRFDLRFKNGEDALFVTSITDNLSKIHFTNDDAIYYVRLRKGSASRKKIPMLTIVRDSFLLIEAYIAVYFTNPKKYSFMLFLSRIPGVIKGACVLLSNK